MGPQYEGHLMEKRLVEAAEKLLRSLERKNLTVSTAESCTGGLIGATITSVPGSSVYYAGGAITYSNESKENMLKVPRGILFAYGAVSEATARCMAKGVLSAYGTDLSVAVTGIAGPAGATETKPVGTVFIAVADGESVSVKEFHFSGDRDSVRSETVFTSLTLLTEFADSL